MVDGHGFACTSEEHTARMSVSMFAHVCSVAQTPHETLQRDPTVPLHILQALEGHCAAEGVCVTRSLRTRCRGSHSHSQFSNTDFSALCQNAHKFCVLTFFFPFFVFIFPIHAPVLSSIPKLLSPQPLCVRLCVCVCAETQPTAQQMNNLAVCVSSVYRANPSVSRHLLIRACLVIVHPCHMHTHTHTLMSIHERTHITSDTLVHLYDLQVSSYSSPGVVGCPVGHLIFTE